ncbi:GNAT family N-acetyltransferase [Phyllobacterium salinisoli]|uniref:GNAT family N-acetyltransferase n=1 Tax=Phyllobacterium salinisoli TaxID=1899321 RepID=A0A368JW51_9HYPH|nr:GNAT family N-acetyltransferase [Phyllobacterium salinisoli]RCS21377.1 GNAT family N-acetyltransferase [Phyllobacterium salinisoli]
MNSESLPYNIIIRPMVEMDVYDIHNIHTECLRTSLAGHYTPQQLESWLGGRTPQGYWRSQQAGSPYLVATINRAIIGYANWIGDELMSLFVQPKFQKSGVGTKLLEACETQTHLSCVKATLSAVEFYGRFGFKVIHEGYDVKREVRIPHIFMRRPT